MISDNLKQKYNAQNSPIAIGYDVTEVKYFCYKKSSESFEYFDTLSELESFLESV
jgi:hypothetical protein